MDPFRHMVSKGSPHDLPGLVTKNHLSTPVIIEVEMKEFGAVGNAENDTRFQIIVNTRMQE